MQETIVKAMSNNEYPIRAAVELLHDGQQLQQRLHAADVKQHAKLATQPMMFKMFQFDQFFSSLRSF